MGATFAYFTASNTASDIGGSGTGEITTTKLGNTTFTFSGKSLNHSYLNFPGGLAVFGSEAKLAKEVSDENKYDLTFDLQIDYINNTDTDLIWALYMVEGNGLEDNLDPKCKLVRDAKTEPGKTRYWYNDDGKKETTTSCTLDATQKSSLSSTTMLAYGTFTKNTDSSSTINGETSASAGGKVETVEPATCTGLLCDPEGGEANNLKDRELSLTSGISVSKFYYLVVQYPNKTSEQQQSTGEEDTPDIQVTLKVTDGSAKVAAQNTVTSQN